TRAHVLPPLKPRCDASLSMRANALNCPHPSRRAHARSRWRHDLAYALLRMRTDIACCKPHRLQHSPSRSRGAVLRPGFASLLRQAPIEGWRSAERRSGAAAPVGHAMTRRVRRLRGALRPIARQDARERAYDAGRSPLGASPWRFWAPGAALLSPALAPDRLQRAPRTQVVVPGGRGPEPPEASGYGAPHHRT